VNNFRVNDKISPSKAELAVGSEEVDMVSELQLEDVVLADAILVRRHADRVAEQRQAGQRTVILTANSVYRGNVVHMSWKHISYE